MLSSIGIPGLILILLLALLLFGPSKLPELGRAVGRTLFEFKRSTRELVKEPDDEKDTSEPKPLSSQTYAQPVLPDRNRP